MRRFYADAFRVAIYEEAPGGGDPIDPNSLMNRPVVSPSGWLGNILFHSDLNYYGIVTAQSVNISHPGVPGSNQLVDPLNSVRLTGIYQRSDHLLATHNLGYVPKFFCIYDGKLIPHGTAVQNEPGNGQRFVTAYATATEIRLGELASSTINALGGATINYQVIVFRDAIANPTSMMLDMQPTVVDFGRGKFRGAEPHLRADGAGDVLWPIATNRTSAIRNGARRTYLPNGGYVDNGSYNGSLVAPSYIVTSAGVF